MQQFIRRLVQKLCRLVLACFSRLGFVRQISFVAAFEKIITSWEKQQRNYIPTSADRWDEQYLEGRWEYMNQLEELARYTIQVGYIAHIRPGGSVLDVGCGEGILFERYQPYGYSKYVGLELSEVALAKLVKLNNEKTTFIKADAETYLPTELFDVIVFNEVVYYFRDPLTVIRRYALALTQHGVLVISIYQSSDAASRRGMEFLRQIKTEFRVVDETRTAQGSRSWVCAVLAPHKTNQGKQRNRTFQTGLTSTSLKVESQVSIGEELNRK